MTKIDSKAFKQIIHDPKLTAEYILNHYQLNEGSSTNVHKLAKIFDLHIKYGVFSTKQDGLYLPPQSDEDIHLVLLNPKADITRQRFTIAHEIGHFLRWVYAGITQNSVEQEEKENKFCDDFAGWLLMPESTLQVYISENFNNDDLLEFEDVHAINRMFGVSYSMAAHVIFYRYNRLNFNQDAASLNESIDIYLQEHDDNKIAYFEMLLFLYRQAIDAYDFELYNIDDSDSHRHLVRVNKYIYNELLNEGISLESETIAELAARLRLYGPKAQFDSIEEDSHIIESIGQYEVYRQLINKEISPSSLHNIKEIHASLYKYAPHGETAGTFRNSNAVIKDSVVDLPDAQKLHEDFYYLENTFQDNYLKLINSSNSAFIEFAVNMHYELVKLHPFQDGNGRVSRAFMNMLFMQKHIPFIFFLNEEKNYYLNGLKAIDKYDDPTRLYIQVYKAILLALA